MFGDTPNTVTAPLTNGSARTGPELQMIEARDQRLGNGPYAETHAGVAPGSLGFMRTIDNSFPTRGFQGAESGAVRMPDGCIHHSHCSCPRWLQSAKNRWVIRSNQLPTILQKTTIHQNLDQPLPLNTEFRDETGRTVHLGDYFGKRPAILALVYYRCTMLCPEEMNGLVGPLEMLKFDPGKAST